MNLVELQKILGVQIESVLLVEDRDSEEYKSVMEKSDIIARLAKQMINNADVILRTDKLIAESKLEPTSTIVKMINSDEMQIHG